MPIGIDVHDSGVRRNTRRSDAADKGRRVIGPAGGYSADGNHILIAGKTGIADVDIVADDSWIGTRSSAQGSIVIASAILKCRAAHRSVVASVSVVLQRERTHSGIVGAVVVIDHGRCPKGAVPCARGVEQKSYGAHCRIGICIVGDQCSGANAGVEIGGASPKQRIPTKSCISSPAGEVTQRVASFRRRETGIATVGRRTDCVRLGQERKAAKRQNY